MRSFTATFFLVALAENLLVPDSGEGLTIYRIGGSDMDPPPEVGMEGVEFVPLSWEGAAQGFDGQMQGQTIEGEQIAPLLITPDDNVMLGALARGGYSPIMASVPQHPRALLLERPAGPRPCWGNGWVNAGFALYRFASFYPTSILPK